MLKIHDLQKNYGKFRALNSLNMEVEPGALYGLVGPNGAGKTTTIRILTGLLLPDGGSVEIDGIDALKEPKKLKAKIGYVPDETGIYDNLKVWEYLEFFSSCYGMEGLTARKRAMTLLEQVGLSGKSDFYVESLSRGMKQRLCLARALLHDPKLLIMDEPTAGLDPRTRMEFRDMLKELNESGKTILISSHILPELAELCTDVGIIDEGRMILHGPVDELVDRARTVKPLIITIHQNRELALQILRADPRVQTISIKDQQLMVGFTGTATQESELLTALTSGGVMVRSFLREPGNLEAVFMQLTNHEEERVVLSYENESGL
jgi:ABC-2 type transport system ATP-binding protein